LKSSNRKQESQKISVIGGIVNLALSVVKVVVGFFGNSGAMIADGIHSLSDLLSDWVVWYASKHANEEPDAEHPYGHERFETVATLGLSFFLVVVGTGIIFDASMRLFNAEPLSFANWLISISIISIASKEALYWYTIFVANKIKSQMLKANAWHHRSDALSSIVVLLGIFGAINGYYYLDSLAAMIVGLLIIYIGWKLGFSATKELVDTSIDPEDTKKLMTELLKIKGVSDVHSLRTRQIGHKKSADVHVQVSPFLSVSEGHIITVSVERVAKECVEDLDDVIVHIDAEDDESHKPYKDLPERAEALKILEQSLKLEKSNYKIERTQLHYLNGEILVDFFLSLDYLSDKKSDEIKSELSDIVCKLPGFGEVKIYFS